MIILLQSVTINFAGFFDIFRITKCGKVILLQSATDCYHKGRQVLQKCDRLLLQSASGITKCDSQYKVIRNTDKNLNVAY